MSNIIAVTCKDCGQTFHGSMEYESTHHHLHHHETSSNHPDYETMVEKPSIFSRVINTFWKYPFGFGSAEKPKSNVNPNYGLASFMLSSSISSSGRTVSSTPTITQYSGYKRRFELSNSSYGSSPKRIRINDKGDSDTSNSNNVGSELSWFDSLFSSEIEIRLRKLYPLFSVAPKIPKDEYCQTWVNNQPDDLDAVDSLLTPDFCKCKDKMGEHKNFQNASTQTSNQFKIV